MDKFGGFRYQWFNNNNKHSLLYGDSNRKIAYIMTPRAGCSVSFKFYLDSLDSTLLEKAIKYNNFIHHYRIEVFDKNIKIVKIEQLIKENYKFIKFVINPFQRAVSSFALINAKDINNIKYDLNFQTYYENLYKNINLHLYANADLIHTYPQYLKGEKELNLTIYKLEDKDKELNINGLKINLKKYSSNHHGNRNIKNNSNKKLYEIKRRNILQNLPTKYKLMYNKQSIDYVQNYYKDDIIDYKYSINDDF